MKKSGILIAVVVLAAIVILYVALPSARSGMRELLPYAVLLLCPIMMLFGMHGSHGAGEKKNDDSSTQSNTKCH